ncbi:MAG: hypothetical protein ACP5OP_02150, partial [Leptospirillia bacterium]
MVTGGDIFFPLLEAVPLRDTDDALTVNWFELTVTDLETGTRLYRNSWITDHPHTTDRQLSSNLSYFLGLFLFQFLVVTNCLLMRVQGHFPDGYPVSCFSGPSLGGVLLCVLVNPVALTQNLQFPQGVKLDQEGARIFLPKVGWVRDRKSRTVSGTVKNVTVRRSGDRWFVS